jgi:8-oxo-dGTP diphosphatase
MATNIRIKDTSITPNLSVDCVIFGFDFSELKVLLIEREEGDFENSPEVPGVLALPGDHILSNEDLDQAAERVLSELTGLNNIFLEQFQAFGHPNRVNNESDRKWMRFIRAEPDARVITVAYYSLVKLEEYEPQASSFARRAAWIPVSEIPILAFDHNFIVQRALESLRLKLKNEPVGFELLPKKFTLSQLQRLYEVIIGTEFEKRNFRRKILKHNFLLALEEKQTGVPHKAARLYQFDREGYEKAREETYGFTL